MEAIYQNLVKYLEYGIALPNFDIIFYQLPKFGKYLMFHATADFSRQIQPCLKNWTEIAPNCVYLIFTL